MPYIKTLDRPQFDYIAKDAIDTIRVDGDLNYLVTRIVHGLLLKRGVNYQNMQNLDGCLGQIQAEFRRVVIGPYEDLKVLENGAASELDASLKKGIIPKPAGY